MGNQRHHAVFVNGRPATVTTCIAQSSTIGKIGTLAIGQQISNIEISGSIEYECPPERLFENLSVPPLRSQPDEKPLRQANSAA